MRTRDVDNVASGALGASPEAGGRASGTEPGRLAAAAAAGEWPDVALIYREHHADLVRLALLMVGDLATAEEMGLVSVERTGGGLMARLAHPLFGELRRASAGEMYLSAIRGRLATRLAKDDDADMQATVRRALLSLESDLDPEPELYLEAARHAMTLLDLDLADRFATAATQAGAPGAATAVPAGAEPADEPEDEELAAYNAYLARLTDEAKGHGRWHGFRT